MFYCVAPIIVGLSEPSSSAPRQIISTATYRMIASPSQATQRRRASSFAWSVAAAAIRAIEKANPATSTTRLPLAAPAICEHVIERHGYVGNDDLNDYRK